MLKVKQGNCEYQLLSLLVQLGQGIKPRSTDYEADTLTSLDHAPVLLCVLASIKLL